MTTRSQHVSRPRALSLLTVGLGLSLSLGLACGTDELDGLDDDEFRIINGAPATNLPEYEATVGLHQRSGDQVGVSPFCSGTLISDEVVLTAAHCCDAAKGGFSFKAMSPGAVAVYFGDGPAWDGVSLSGEFYGVSQVEIHPQYSRNSLNNDICLLRLSVPNTTSPTIPPLPASLGLSNADKGILLDHVGFGYSDTNKTQYGVKLQAEVPLAGLGCVVPGCPTPGNNGQFSYKQDGNPYFGPCNGDSGGPAFINRGGKTYVAGITSYGDPGCEIYGVSTNVSAYQSFIEGFSGPVGPDCSADGMCNAECAAGADPDCGGGEPSGCDNDGVCEAGESCDGRNSTSACPNDCAGKTKGKAADQFCFVEGVCEGPGC